MIQNKKISLVIPCRNEAKSIASLLKKIPRFIDEVIVVDNRSTDDTYTIAKSYGARVLKENRLDGFGIGYGYALRRGMAAAKGDIIVSLDGDGTYPVNQIGRAISFMIKKNLSLVIGNRFPINNQAISFLRQYGVWILNQEASIFYGYEFKDILSGMWLINRSLLRQLNLKQGGWNLSPEIKLACLQASRKGIGQFHIDHYYRDFGASKQKIWQTGVNHLVYIFLRWLTVDQPLTSLAQTWLSRINLRLARALVTYHSLRREL
ncbi:hypothetical protein A3A66_04740 [Microgenomates group bacterium RIFCSPLOWO2_01_FULL_46_13]|nr:MAG: hypothetical protein A2783_00205 [Microgenomates group bacterium RIFCSPHIGHO2_01_FULL_45_11]OGV94273.1 MAG: hypothetical protein A3A66_04740 [Microgenomates group bacterium RIFCSPLOWO2_01_FULL_46_13]